MIIIWLWYSNANDIQMRIIHKCELFTNANDIQTQMIFKCECSANDNLSQIIILLN